MPFEDGAFGRVFISHFFGLLLPPEQEPFLAEARRMGGDLVVVESAKRDEVREEEWQERLKDGSRHRVYNRFFTGPAFAAELGGGDIMFEGRWLVVIAT